MRWIRAVTALLAVALQIGCASLEGLRFGREAKTDAQVIVYVQRVLDLYGEQGALLRLTATGMKPERAARLLLDAQAARGPVAAPPAPAVRSTPEPFDGGEIR